MEEQKNNPLLQMNANLNSATVNIAADPKARREAYRATLRLLQYSFPSDTNAPLAKALNYENAVTVASDMNALARIILQVQRAFREDGIACFWYEEDTQSKDCGLNQGGQENHVPDWLKAEQDHWRRFELIATDKTQIDELNAVLASSNFTRRDLALIVTCLRLRPEFSLDDFTAKTDSGEPFATDDP